MVFSSQRHSVRRQPSGNHQRKRPLRPVMIEVCQWTAFTVVFSASPLIINIMHMSITKKPVAWEHLLGDGELSVIAIALAVASAGECLRLKSERYRLLKVCVCWTAMACTVAGTIIFNSAKDAVDAQADVNWHLMATLSSAIYLSSIVAGICAVVLSTLIAEGKGLP